MSAYRDQFKERELPDDYPVYGDYLYVADGNVIRSNVFGTVRDLKRDTGAKVITNCDIYARREALAKAGEL